MHGIVSKAEFMQPVADHIEKFYPGTSILNVDLYDEADSLVAMDLQVDGVREKVKPFMEKAKDGVNMVCYSQGTLICRAILERMEDHNVHTFISISGPHAGQYGDTDYLKFFFPNFTKEHIYELFYSDLGQEISVANYWKDPHHLDLYEKYCIFLSSLNNASPEHKKNFLRIQRAVFIGGPDDGVITPWQSRYICVMFRTTVTG
jgi:palmitoyl-protein thioesterase